MSEEEIKELKKLNTTLSKALAAEMASNFSQSHIRQNLEEKIERIEEHVILYQNAWYPLPSIYLKELKAILKEEPTQIDPALQSKKDAKEKLFR